MQLGQSRDVYGRMYSKWHRQVNWQGFKQAAQQVAQNVAHRIFNQLRTNLQDQP